MALPGFSVTELIQALGQAKSIYDAFFNEHTKSSVQVRGLANEIEQFRQNLKTHQGILEKHRLTYSGYDDIKTTLDSCHRFLDKYRIILGERRSSFTGAFKTAKYVFDADEVQKLRDELARHHQNIMSFSMNVVLCVMLPTYRVSLMLFIEKKPSTDWTASHLPYPPYPYPIQGTLKVPYLHRHHCHSGALCCLMPTLSRAIQEDLRLQ